MDARMDARVDAEDPAEPKREARLRREAARLGLALRKSRTRNPLRMDYRRYKIMNATGDYCMAGGFPFGYSLTLDDVEAILGEVEARREDEELKRAWAAAHPSVRDSDAKNRR